MLGKQRWAGRRQSHDLMGRARSSDQIIINNRVWGGPAASIRSTCALLVPVGRVPSQGKKTREWKLNSSRFCWVKGAMTALCAGGNWAQPGAGQGSSGTE